MSTPSGSDGRQRRADLTAQQHRAGGLDGDVGEHRDVPSGLGHRPSRSQHRGLELQQVLAGLHQDGVGASVQHAECGLGVGVANRPWYSVCPRVGSLVPGPIEPST